MEDQYVVLLERVVAENVRLREELEARDNEQKRILAELGAKIEGSANSGQERASGKRKRKISVPQQCRVSIFLSWFLVDHDRLVCCYMCLHYECETQTASLLQATGLAFCAFAALATCTFG